MEKAPRMSSDHPSDAFSEDAARYFCGYFSGVSSKIRSCWEHALGHKLSPTARSSRVGRCCSRPEVSAIHLLRFRSPHPKTECEVLSSGNVGHPWCKPVAPETCSPYLEDLHLGKQSIGEAQAIGVVVGCINPSDSHQHLFWPQAGSGILRPVSTQLSDSGTVPPLACPSSCHIGSCFVSLDGTYGRHIGFSGRSGT